VRSYALALPCEVGLVVDDRMAGLVPIGVRSVTGLPDGVGRALACALAPPLDVPESDPTPIWPNDPDPPFDSTVTLHSKRGVLTVLLTKTVSTRRGVATDRARLPGAWWRYCDVFATESLMRKAPSLTKPYATI